MSNRFQANTDSPAFVGVHSQDPRGCLRQALDLVDSQRAAREAACGHFRQRALEDGTSDHRVRMATQAAYMRAQVEQLTIAAEALTKALYSCPADSIVRALLNEPTKE